MYRMPLSWFSYRECSDFHRGHNVRIGPFVRIRSSSAYLGDSARIDRYCRIHANRFIMGKGSRFQINVSVTNQRVDEKTICEIGENAEVFRDSLLDCTTGITIGKNVGVGGRSCIWTHGGWEQGGHPIRYAPVVIEDNAWLAWEVTVNPGITIGEGAEVWAKSMVTKNVAPYTVVAGNPARVIKSLK